KYVACIARRTDIAQHVLHPSTRIYFAARGSRGAASARRRAGGRGGGASPPSSTHSVKATQSESMHRLPKPDVDAGNLGGDLVLVREIRERERERRDYGSALGFVRRPERGIVTG